MDRFRGGLALNAHGELRFYVSSVALFLVLFYTRGCAVPGPSDMIPPDRSGPDVFLSLRAGLGAPDHG